MPGLSTSSGRRAALITMLAAATALADCNKSGAPTGQVVATVNGDDITRRDVQAELVAAKAPADIDIKEVQPLVVDQIVKRKLLVEEARNEKLDKTPEFLAAEQRAREIVLDELLIQRWANKLTPPSSDQVQGYISDNPQMFAERREIMLDQIRLSASGIDPAALKPLATNDAVAAYLTQIKHPFGRGTTTVDSASLNKQGVAQIEGLAPGTPFSMTQGDTMLIDVVVGTKPTPVPEARWPALAKEALGKQAIDKFLSDQINSLRGSAKIQYQDGFAPPPKPAPAPAH